LQHDPRNTTAMNDLGVARDLLANHAGAQQAYRQALGIDPEFYAAQVNLALSMAMSGSAADAVRMLRPMASNPGASRKLQQDLAAALAMAGNREEAAQILSKDLSPAEVQQALDDYAAARSEGAGAALASVPRGEEAAVALTPASSGGMQVRFAAVPTRDAARAEWQRLQQQIPVLLSGRQPMFTKVERNGQTLWHVGTGGFTDVAQVTAFCQKVQAAGRTCSIDEP
jgi:tetratricopeptide (TPR) repeat protein